MNDFDQKNTDLYRFDGRFYDLNEADGVLTLQLRRSVVWERSLVIALVSLFCWMATVVVSYLSWNSSPNKISILLRLLYQSGMSLYLYSIWHSLLVTRQNWVLNKISGKICCGQIDIAPLYPIYEVKAWQRGAKFYLALKSKNDKPRQIGRFGFCRSEYAWRQDAAQIAHFLGVPLEIPPIISA